MTKLIVRKQRTGPILGRHPWVFSGALQQIPEGLKSGEPVILTNEMGCFLAQGYFNSYSQIAVRLWGWDETEIIDDKFFEKKVKRAYEIRKNLVESKGTDSYRMIHGENDLLPGLIVDKYADYLALQFHTPGMEAWKNKIIDALKKVIKPKGIYERSDVRVRGIEGAQKQVGELFGKTPARVKISENGYKFWVDIIGGQKTGFFLDQRDKRLALQKYCEEKNVLNCFSYSGGFSIYALAAGAKRVISVDSSESAIELARENIKLNKLDVKKCEFICGDVKQYLQDVKNASDIIILDPPAFVKDRHKVIEGLIGYKKINEAALRLLSSDGVLVTASCSAHVSLSDFRYMLSESAGRARRTLQVLETHTHGIDHLELAAFTEGEYLKCLFARVV